VNDYSIELLLRFLREVMLTMKMGWSPPMKSGGTEARIKGEDRMVKKLSRAASPYIHDISVNGSIALSSG
jgi:hypothetical protein